MVSVRYGDEEIEQIRSAAERQGSSVSAFIRRASLADEPRPRFTIEVGTSNVPANQDFDLT